MYFFGTSELIPPAHIKIVANSFLTSPHSSNYIHWSWDGSSPCSRNHIVIATIVLAQSVVVTSTQALDIECGTNFLSTWKQLGCFKKATGTGLCFGKNQQVCCAVTFTLQTVASMHVMRCWYTWWERKKTSCCYATNAKWTLPTCMFLELTHMDNAVARRRPVNSKISQT